MTEIRTITNGPASHQNISNELKSLLTVGQAYDDLAIRARDLEAKLTEALTALEGRNARIVILEEGALAERDQYRRDCERRDKEVANYRAAADQAIGERNELRIILGNFRAQLNAVELSPDPSLDTTSTQDAGQHAVLAAPWPHTPDR